MPQIALKRETSELLGKLAQLPSGWDGHDSPPIKTETIEQAERVLAALEAESAPAPHICPVAGGGVQLEWQHGGRELEIEILPDGSVQYLTVHGNDMDEGILPLPATDD
ncbi:MAG TPA: hypothetical protein VKX17_23290 [Planctomycetota bacterium]|nr:hypothetical protein [Planctomycetota bacterium]